MQYQNALDRNSTMVREIVSQTRLATGELPIAFIGNFHTSGIIPGLQAAGIGYVIIEPRLKVPYTEEENRAFEQANHGDSRDAHLSSVRLKMGFNGMTAAEVRRLGPKFDAKIADARTMQTSFERDFSAVSGAAVVVGRLAGTRNNNGSISELVISSGAISCHRRAISAPHLPGLIPMTERPAANPASSSPIPNTENGAAGNAITSSETPSSSHRRSEPALRSKRA